MFSMWAYMTAAALQGAWVVLTPDQREILPPATVGVLTIAVLILGFIGRLVRQESIQDARTNRAVDSSCDSHADS